MNFALPKQTKMYTEKGLLMIDFTAENIRQYLSERVPADLIEAPVVVVCESPVAVVRSLRENQQRLYLVWWSTKHDELHSKLVTTGGANELVAVEEAVATTGYVKLHLSWWIDGRCRQRACIYEGIFDLSNI